MFDRLTEKLNSAFKKLRGRGKLSEEQVKDGLKEIRRILLAADVHYSVVKKFVKRVENKAIGEEVLKSLTPGEQIIKIVREELQELLGGQREELGLHQHGPTPIILVGLQGTGKTTTAGKLALHYREQKKTPILYSADYRRPAAREQLRQLAEENQLEFYPEQYEDPRDDLPELVEYAENKSLNPVIIDTAGRLNIDQPMLEEIGDFQRLLPESRVLLVIDGMMGQEALQVAEDFAGVVQLDGLILTKMEGDARGGAAISAREVTGVPVLYIGTGEKAADFQPFHPERMASRILGMGDVFGLIEDAEKAADAEEQAALQERFMKGKITMADLDKQFDQLKKMGPLEGLLERLPGGYQLKNQMQNQNFDARDIDRMQAIIRSMTPEERENPRMINGSRRRRIAEGSGTSRELVNQLLKQFKMMKKMMDDLRKNQGMIQKLSSGMGMGGFPGL